LAKAAFFSFDENYLRHLIAGDPETEHHFVEYFSVLLSTKLQFRLRRAQDVDDLRQEVFLRVLQSLRRGSGLEHPGKLGAFVNAVCNNVILEHFRSKSRTSQWDDAAPNPPESASDFEHDLLSEELRAQVRNLLDGLPTKDRTLLRAVFFEERDKDAVCRDYGVHRAYLRVLLHRAKRRLRDLLPGPHTGTTAPDTFRISGGAL
jgi:RNA polymerase sigma-70 factor, ECF subfamily